MHSDFFKLAQLFLQSMEFDTNRGMGKQIKFICKTNA